MRYLKAICILILTCAIALLSGCGGGGLPGQSVRNGSIGLNVIFPERTVRSLPVATNSVRITITDDRGEQPLVPDIVLSRGVQGQPVQATVPGVRPGPCNIRAQGYESANGQGQVIAKAETTVDVVGGQTTQVSLTTQALVVRLMVSPTDLTLTSPTGGVDVIIRQGQGQSAGLSATCYDADNNIILGTLNWSSSDPTVAAVDSDGVVTARKPGTCVITAADAITTAFGECSVYVQEPPKK